LAVSPDLSNGLKVEPPSGLPCLIWNRLAWRVVCFVGRRATKPFFGPDENTLKPGFATYDLDQTTGFDHVGIHHQPGLRPVLQEIPRRHGETPAPVDLRMLSRAFRRSVPTLAPMSGA
jgi:hypothetical protein